MCADILTQKLTGDSRIKSLKGFLHKNLDGSNAVEPELY